MLKYLIFILIGIILYKILNLNEYFSIGANVNQYFFVRYCNNTFRLISYSTVDEYIHDLQTPHIIDGNFIHPVQIYGANTLDMFTVATGTIRVTTPITDPQIFNILEYMLAVISLKLFLT